MSTATEKKSMSNLDVKITINSQLSIPQPDKQNSMLPNY